MSEQDKSNKTENTPIFVDNGLFYLIEISDEEWKTYWRSTPSNNKAKKE